MRPKECRDKPFVKKFGFFKKSGYKPAVRVADCHPRLSLATTYRSPKVMVTHHPLGLFTLMRTMGQNGSIGPFLSPAFSGRRRPGSPQARQGGPSRSERTSVPSTAGV